MLAKVRLCSLRSRIWDKSVPETCIDVSSLLNNGEISNMLTDDMILPIPVKAIWSLRLSKKWRVAVVLIFATGSLYVSQDTGLLVILSASWTYSWDWPTFSLIDFVVRIKISATRDVAQASLLNRWSTWQELYLSQERIWIYHVPVFQHLILCVDVAILTWSKIKTTRRTGSRELRRCFRLSVGSGQGWQTIVRSLRDRQLQSDVKSATELRIHQVVKAELECTQ